MLIQTVYRRSNQHLRLMIVLSQMNLQHKSRYSIDNCRAPRSSGDHHESLCVGSLVTLKTMVESRPIVTCTRLSQVLLGNYSGAPLEAASVRMGN